MDGRECSHGLFSNALKNVLIGNVYVSPKIVKQLYILDEILQKCRSKDLMIIGNFNAQNPMWDKRHKTRHKAILWLTSKMVCVVIVF